MASNDSEVDTGPAQVMTLPRCNAWSGNAEASRGWVTNVRWWALAAPAGSDEPPEGMAGKATATDDTTDDTTEDTTDDTTERLPNRCSSVERTARPTVGYTGP